MHPTTFPSFKKKIRESIKLFTFFPGLGWLHCDDSLIKSMTEAMVMSHSANSVPYILFYRRYVYPILFYNTILQKS